MVSWSPVNEFDFEGSYLKWPGESKHYCCILGRIRSDLTPEASRTGQNVGEPTNQESGIRNQESGIRIPVKVRAIRQIRNQESGIKK